MNNFDFIRQEQETALEDAGWTKDTVDLDSLRDNLEGAIECLYETGDVYKLESFLDEMAHSLGVKMNMSTPVISKKENNSMLQWYMGYQRATMDMNKGGE